MIKTEDIKKIIEFLNEKKINSLEKLEYALCQLKEKYNKSSIAWFLLISLLVQGGAMMGVNKKPKDKQSDVITSNQSIVMSDVAQFIIKDEISIIMNPVSADIPFKENDELSSADPIEEEVEKTPEEIIVEKFDLTLEQLHVIAASVAAEAGENQYDEAYNVINSIYNRTKSKKWVNEMKRVLGRSDGDNLYVQLICPGQYSVYESGSYKKFLGQTDLPAYQAVIDFLLREEYVHEYMSFGSKERDMSKYNAKSLTNNGNQYFDILADDDRIEEDIEEVDNKKLEIMERKMQR